MLKDRINDIKEYFIGMEVTNGTSILKVKYPHKWGVFPNQENTIQVTREEESDENTYYYYADYETVPFEQMFSLVEETAKMNINAQKKITLLHDKFEELKELFASNDYEVLENLKFELGKPKPKRKPRRKAKPKPSEEIKQEEVVVVQEEENKPLEAKETDNNNGN